MANLCRVKIVGDDLNKLGMEPYRGILTSTNSFILDLTKQLNSQKSAGITEHPTFVSGRKRVEQVVPEPETLNIEGAISNYRTNSGRGNDDIVMFREMLEYINENAILLDIETESKSHYNYIIQTINVGQSGMGTITVSLTLREVWLFSATEEIKDGIGTVTPGGELNDQVKEQSIKASLTSLLRDIHRSASNRDFTRIISAFIEGALKIGDTANEAKTIDLNRIKVGPLVNVDKFVREADVKHYVNSFMKSGIVHRKSNDFEEFFNIIKYEQYPDILENVEAVDQTLDINGYEAKIKMPSRILYKGEDASIYNQFAFYKSVLSNLNDQLKNIDNNQHIFDISIRKPLDPNETYQRATYGRRRFHWDVDLFLSGTNNSKFNTSVSNAIFKIVNDEVVFNIPMGIHSDSLGLAYYTYGYEINPDNGILVADVTGANYIVGKFSYISQRMLKLILQVLYAYSKERSLTLNKELLDIANMDGS